MRPELARELDRKLRRDRISFAVSVGLVILSIVAISLIATIPPERLEIVQGNLVRLESQISDDIRQARLVVALESGDTVRTGYMPGDSALDPGAVICLQHARNRLTRSHVYLRVPPSRCGTPSAYFGGPSPQANR